MMHVVWGILPENFVSEMYSSLICCCLLRNVHLNLLSCLSICTDPLPMAGSFHPANFGSLPLLPLPAWPLLRWESEPAICPLYTASKPSRSTVCMVSLSTLKASTDHPNTAFKLKALPFLSHLVGHPLPPVTLASSLPLNHTGCFFPFSV